MKARCDLEAKCEWFSADGTAYLHTYMPLPSRFIDLRTANASGTLTPSSGPCRGSYIKEDRSVQSTACPRIHGYLFHARVSVSPSDLLPRCSECWNSTELALECNSTSDCVGFSNLHGIISSHQFHSGSFSTSLTPFTTSPCYGAYQLIGGHSDGVPLEVGTLDRVFCGETTYCSSGSVQFLHKESTDSIHVDLELVLYSDLLLPSWLTTPNADDVLSLPTLPRVRTLHIKCVNGSSLMGGAPRPLFWVFPNLQILSISSCNLTGPLPPEYSMLEKLQVRRASKRIFITDF